MGHAFLLRNLFFVVPLFGLSVSNGQGYGTKDFGPVQNWPKYDHFGQISAVGVDHFGNVYVFHRGNRQWDSNTFSINNVFVDKDEGPISEDTIVVLDQNEGSLLKKTGSNLFYLPHGLTMDDDNNVWVTDVALHQVFKFPPIDLRKESKGLKKPLLTLGARFEPGSDLAHFCKPSAVAVVKETKEFYVSDGYCNSRIIKYDESGNVLLTLGRHTVLPQRNFYMLNIPHALAVAQDTSRIFVADRENSRVLSYNYQSGKFIKSYAEELKSRVFSVAYSPLEGGLLFTLLNDNSTPKMVAVYNVKTGKLILSFSPKTNNFTNPHDLAVSYDGKYCYVVELNPYKIWKFNLDMKVISQMNNEAVTGQENKIEKPIEEEVEKLVPAESKVDKTSNLEVSSSFLAVGLVASIVLISFLIFMFHYYKRNGGYRRYETRRLILDDDDGGIRLT